MSARTSVKIDLSGSDAVRAAREGFSSLEKSERSRVLRAFRRARSRVLTLYGAEAAEKLAEDFRLKKTELRALRLFRSTAKGRVWVGGNAMNLISTLVDYWVFFPLIFGEGERREGKRPGRSPDGNTKKARRGSGRAFFVAGAAKIISRVPRRERPPAFPLPENPF